MSNEISVAVRVRNSQSGQRFEPATVQIDQAAVGAQAAIVLIGTSEEDIDLGDVSTPGIVCLKNLDATNFVKWGPKDTTMTELGRLAPGEVAVFRMAPSGVTLRMIADTASCKVQIIILEN